AAHVLDRLVADDPRVGEVNDRNLAGLEETEPGLRGLWWRHDSGSSSSKKPRSGSRSRILAISRGALPATHRAARSERVECGLLLSGDLEDLVEPRDPENFQQVGVNAAELELPFDSPDLLLEVDELAERGAREVLDVAEIQQELPVPLFFDQTVKLVTN